MHTSRFQDLGRRSRESGNPAIQPGPWVPALRCASAGTTRMTLQPKAFRTYVHALSHKGRGQENVVALPKPCLSDLGAIVGGSGYLRQLVIAVEGRRRGQAPFQRRRALAPRIGRCLLAGEQRVEGDE